MPDLLMTVTASYKRRRILLLLLLHGPQSLDDLRQKMLFPSTALLPQIRMLEGWGLIQKEEKMWDLTRIGQIIAERLHSLVQITGTLDRHPQYWQEHTINLLPREFISRIAELGEYSILVSDETRAFIPKEFFHAQMKKTRFFRGMSAMIHPDHLYLYLNMARMGRDIAHITTRSAHETLLAMYPDEMEEFSRTKPDLFLVSQVDFEWECVVTDEFLFLSLFKGGAIDPISDLISADESARVWGCDLFRHYQRLAEQPSRSSMHPA